jgi:hypothetical protein
METGTALEAFQFYSPHLKIFEYKAFNHSGFTTLHTKNLKRLITGDTLVFV